MSRRAVGPVGWIAVAIVVWWMVAAPNVGPEYRLIYLKELTTVTAQAAFLLLVARMHAEPDRHALLRALDWLAFWVALGALVFAAHIWRGEVPSILGLVLPERMLTESAFFGSIGTRSFGVTDVEDQFFSERVRSLALSYSSLSFITLLLIPFTAWRFRALRGPRRLQAGMALVGLMVGLLFTQSRVSFGAIVASGAFGVGLLLWRRLRFGIAGALTVSLLALTGLTGVAIAVWEPVSDLVRTYVLELRPGSAAVRTRIYAESIRLLPQHWLVGWGTSIRIPGMANRYSAGTHSVPLGILFQHGVVGFVLYYSLVYNIWKQVLKGVFSSRYAPPPGRSFFLVAAVGLMGFHLREVADLWAWDQLLALCVWCTWGSVLIHTRLRENALPDEVGSQLVNSSRS